MTWREVGSDARRLFTLILEATAATGEWPVFQHLDREGHREGVERPHECLEGIPDELVTFDRPLEDASRVRSSLRGALVGGLEDNVLDAFLKIPVALSKRRDIELPSPTQAQPVIVHAHELWSAEMGSASDLVIVGMLLEVEEIGIVMWSGDRTSPWSVEIDYRIRDYASVVTLADYLRIRYPDEH